MARYLAVFDADEFFLPQGSHTTYQSVLSQLAPHHVIPEPSSYPPTTLEKMEQEFSVQKGGGRGVGWADKDGHPYCYFAVESYILTKQRRNYVVDPHNPWIGVRYPHGPEPINDQSTRRFRYSRIIIPTDRIFQATFNLAGACKLPLAWTTCYEPIKPFSVEVLGTRAAGMLTKQQQKELVHNGNEHPQLQTFDFKPNVPRKNVIRDVTGYSMADPHTGEPPSSDRLYVPSDEPLPWLVVVLKRHATITSTHPLYFPPFLPNNDIHLPTQIFVLPMRLVPCRNTEKGEDLWISV